MRRLGMNRTTVSFTESLFLWKDAQVVLTDSGGLQEETTALGKPCVTIRDNTERPVTVQIGTNVLAGTKKEDILRAYDESIEKAKKSRVPEKWDGKAAERIWDVIQSVFGTDYTDYTDQKGTDVGGHLACFQG